MSPASARRRQDTGRVLILARASQILLAVARSLGRRGITLDVATAHEDEPLLVSRYVAAVHFLPPYRPDGDEWLEGLSTLLDNGSYDLLLPLDEPSIYAAQAHREALETRVRTALLEPEVFATVFDKGRTYDLARSLDIPLPGQLEATRPLDIESYRRRFAPPFVLKPMASYGGPHRQRRRDVRKVYDPEELESALEQMLAAGPVLLQENVRGTGYGVEVLAAGGRPLLLFAHRRVHEPIHGGGSSYRASVSVPPELEAASRRLLEVLRYTGVAMIEFRVDEATGRWVLLEINGRFWGSLPLALAAGADFPHALYRLLVHSEERVDLSYRRGIHCRNLVGDLKWLGANLRADRSDPLLSTLPWYRVAAEIRHPLALRERWDTFALDDPRPALAELGHYLRLYARRAGDRLRRAWVGFGPIRRRLERRARRAAAHSTRILFVCKGNICRSPFAEGYARMRGPAALHFASSGFYPVPARPSPETAIVAAAEVGVDLDRHRADVLDFRQVREADLILTFDEEVHRTVRRSFPEARWKTHRLAALADGGPIDVADPFGRDLDTFRTCYRRIAELVDAAPWGRDLPSPIDAPTAEEGEP